MATAWACASGARSAVRAPARIFERFFVPTIQALRLVLPTSHTRRRIDARYALIRRFILLLCAVGVVPVAAAQEPQEPLFSRLNLDKLQLVSLGASIGRIMPSQAVPTGVYALSADYGEFAPSWHIVFGVSYWESRFRDAVVQQFVDSLSRHLSDTTGNVRILGSRISLYDVTFNAEARYTPTYSGELKPYIGLGLAAHVVNADGDLINGTFVERSLDAISPGLFVDVGVALKILKHLGIEGGARGDLLSGFRSLQIRGGAAYYFGHVRAPRTTGDGK